MKIHAVSALIAGAGTAERMVIQMEIGNRPLEMQDILNMDGEPVWLEFPNSYRYPGGWYLVAVWSEKFCVAHFLNSSNNWIVCSKFFDDGGKAYRKRPEGAKK